jgi:hypothetical protein
MIDDYIYEAIAVLGVRIVYTDLPPDRDGEYLHRRKLIRLQIGMEHRLHRCVLAHECCHAVFEDVTSKFGPVNAKQERRADEWAALRLVSLTDYMRAEIIHGGHEGAIAVELNVTVDLLRVFRSMLLVVGERTYVQPRMGAGQWLHRKLQP